MIRIVKQDCKIHGNTPRSMSGKCRKCSSIAVSRTRKNRKAELVKLFGGACLLCKYNKCMRALHFHHLNPSDKRFALGERGLCKSFYKHLEEARKCVLLCSRCHDEVEGGIELITLEHINHQNKLLERNLSTLRQNNRLKRCTMESNHAVLT